MYIALSFADTPQRIFQWILEELFLKTPLSRSIRLLLTSKLLLWRHI